MRLPYILPLLFPVSVLSANVYSLASVVPWGSKNATSTDQAAVHNGTAYFADRTNKVVQIINLANSSKVGEIGGFVGLVLTNGKSNTTISGPNGLLVLPDRNELYVGDANGTIRVVDLNTNTVVAMIHTGASTRADEMAYDATRHIVAATLPDEETAAVALISASNRTVLGTVPFPNATDGLEQPAWSQQTGDFYISVPATMANEGGEIAVLSSTTMSVTKAVPVPECIPAGIVFSAYPTLFVGCSGTQISKFNFAFSLVMDVSSGKVLGNISGLAGIDQVAYSAPEKLFFAAAYQNSANGKPNPVLGVVNASNYMLVQSLPTDNLTAHAVAVDQVTGQVVVPLTHSGIGIYNFSAAAVGSGGSSPSPSPSSSTSPSSSGAAKPSGSASSEGVKLGKAGLVGWAGTLLACALLVL